MDGVDDVVDGLGGAELIEAPGGDLGAVLGRALELLGLPSLALCALVVGLVAVVVVRLNEGIKAQAPRAAEDGPLWQWAWRILPAVEGAALGLLIAALGAVSYPAGALLGVIGGAFAVPLWHLIRARLPGLLGSSR